MGCLVLTDSVKFILGVFSAINVSTILVQLTRDIFFYWKCATLAKYLHETLLTSVLRSPMIFFDSNPLGRILNRFSSDIDIMESVIPSYIFEFCVCSFQMITVFVIITFTIPLFTIVLFPIGIMFIFIQRIYINTSRQLQRIYAITSSPVLNHFCGMVHGATSIRAFRVMKYNIFLLIQNTVV